MGVGIEVGTDRYIIIEVGANRYIVVIVCIVGGAGLVDRIPIGTGAVAQTVITSIDSAASISQFCGNLIVIVRAFAPPTTSERIIMKLRIRIRDRSNENWGRRKEGLLWLGSWFWSSNACSLASIRSAKEELKTAAGKFQVGHCLFVVGVERASGMVSRGRQSILRILRFVNALFVIIKFLLLVYSLSHTTNLYGNLN